MEVLSVYRGARISAFKARELTREIQGLPASAALDLIAFSPKKAALLVGKTLKSAIANAENNNELRVDTLVVKEATVGEGPTMKRMKSRARGSSSQIRKRTSHIRIILSDEIEIPQRRAPKDWKAKRHPAVSQRLDRRDSREVKDRGQRMLPQTVHPTASDRKLEEPVPIQAFARFKPEELQPTTFEAGRRYILEVGVETQLGRLIASTPHRFLGSDGSIQFDILVGCDRDKVKITPTSVQFLPITSDKNQNLEYEVVPITQGEENIEVHFLYQGSWAAQLTLPMHVISQKAIS